MLFLRTQKRYQPADGNSRSWAGDGLGMACGTTGMAISLTLLRTAPTHRPCPVRTALCAPPAASVAAANTGPVRVVRGGGVCQGHPTSPKTTPKKNKKKTTLQDHHDRQPYTQRTTQSQSHTRRTHRRSHAASRGAEWRACPDVAATAAAPHRRGGACMRAA